jgi:hypothetical protein
MKVAGKAQASGPKAGFEMSGPKDGKLGELKAYAELAKASAEGSISNQFLTVKGKAEAGIGAEATAAASFTNEGLKAEVEASAGAKASAEYRVDAGPLGYGAKAEGFAGAQAGAGLTAGKDGLEGKAEAFAGAKGSVRGQADIGGIGAGCHGRRLGRRRCRSQRYVWQGRRREVSHRRLSGCGRGGRRQGGLRSGDRPQQGRRHGQAGGPRPRWTCRGRCAR